MPRTSRRRIIARKRYKYQALITLNPPGDGSPDAKPSLHGQHLAVRA